MFAEDDTLTQILSEVEITQLQQLDTTSYNTANRKITGILVVMSQL